MSEYQKYKRDLAHKVGALLAYATKHRDDTFQSLAKRFRMTPGVVAYYLHKSGWELRKPGKKAKN